ncbi:hypothetical protein M5K25_015602 [Dendrobium thyrsiflorum]|uniref:Uncharacterized protein n=1 Tax=Dendrobium thyrsiflorum TaxID=117978 RepID=A0ABD0UXL6_DENTH
MKPGGRMGGGVGPECRSLRRLSKGLGSALAMGDRKQDGASPRSEMLKRRLEGDRVLRLEARGRGSFGIGSGIGSDDGSSFVESGAEVGARVRERIETEGFIYCGRLTNAPQQMWFASRANHDFSELQRFTSLQDFAPSAACVTLLLLCAGFRRSRVPVCELLHETLVQVSGGAVYQFFGRSRMKMSTSSSGIVGSERSSVLSFLHSGLVDDGILLVQPKALYELWDNFFGPLLRAFADLLKKNFFDPRSLLYRCVEGFAESLPRFTCSICDAKSGSDSSSSGKYRSSSELQSICNTIIQDSGAAPLTYSSFTGVLGNTEMTRQTSVGRESASPFSSASPTLSSDIKSANLMGFEELAWLGRCLEKDACTLGNPFRLSIGSSSWRPQSPIVPPELASYHLFFHHPGERQRTLLPGSHRLRGTGNILWSGLASNVVSFVTTLRSTPYSRDLRHSEIWRISMKENFFDSRTAVEVNFFLWGGWRTTGSPGGFSGVSTVITGVVMSLLLDPSPTILNVWGGSPGSHTGCHAQVYFPFSFFFFISVRLWPPDLFSLLPGPLGGGSLNPSSELCIPELIGIRAPSSSEGELGPQVVGPRKISLAHQRSYFSLPTLGQQIYSGWEYWLQVPEQADLMGAQASSAEP